jgi:hypothetical protein
MNPGVAQEMLNDVVTSMNPETDPGPLPTNEIVVQQQNGN